MKTCLPEGKIIVTGGAGFIGSQIVDAYLTLGYQVVVIDDLSTGKKENVNPQAKFYQVDIRDAKGIEGIFKKEKPQIVNHQAAQKSVRHSVQDPGFDAEVNILGLLNLLEAAQKVKVKKFIFASSGGVIYGETDKIPTPENHPSQPTSPYGVTKYCSELYLDFWQKQYNLRHVALRYSNVYGPRQDPEGEAGVVGIFIQRILDGKKPIIYGRGRQTRDYVYVGDVVESNIRALKTNMTGAFNIGVGKETSVNELFKKIVQLMDVKIKAIRGPVRAGEQHRSALDCQKARRLLSWMPQFSLEQGLKETINYFKKE